MPFPQASGLPAPWPVVEPRLGGATPPDEFRDDPHPGGVTATSGRFRRSSRSCGICTGDDALESGEGHGCHPAGVGIFGVDDTGGVANA